MSDARVNPTTPVIFQTTNKFQSPNALRKMSIKRNNDIQLLNSNDKKFDARKIKGKKRKQSIVCFFF